MNQLLRNTLEDMVGRLMYYDRKEDDDLPRGAIEDMVRKGETTVDEMTQVFADELRKVCK